MPAAVRMPAVVRMPACHGRRFRGERPIGAATGYQSQPPRPCANPPPPLSIPPPEGRRSPPNPRGGGGLSPNAPPPPRVDGQGRMRRRRGTCCQPVPDGRALCASQGMPWRAVRSLWTAGSTGPLRQASLFFWCKPVSWVLGPRPKDSQALLRHRRLKKPAQCMARWHKRGTPVQGFAEQLGISWGGGGGGNTPPPIWTRISKREKVKFTKGNVDLGYFWYPNFWVPDPPPHPPP